MTKQIPAAAIRCASILLAATCVGAIALGTLVPAKAQYYYPRPPEYGFNYPPPDDRLVTDGLGMTARPVGQCRAETACPTDGALGAVLAESGGGPLMQRGADQPTSGSLAIFAAIRSCVEPDKVM